MQQTGLEPELLIFPIHYSSFYCRDAATHLRLYTSERKVQLFFFLNNIRCNCRFFQSQVSFLTPGHSLWNSKKFNFITSMCVNRTRKFWIPDREFETYFLARNDVNEGFVSMYRGQLFIMAVSHGQLSVMGYESLYYKFSSQCWRFTPKEASIVQKKATFFLVKKLSWSSWTCFLKKSCIEGFRNKNPIHHSFSEKKNWFLAKPFRINQ